MNPTTQDDLDDQEAQLARFLTVISEDGGMREVRALDVTRSSYPDKQPHVELGYFKATDLEQVRQFAAHYRRETSFPTRPGSKALSGLAGSPKGVYFTLNPVKDAAYARAPATMVTAGRNGSTSDAEILRRTLLLIDVDAPREVTGVPASEAEKSEALEICGRVRSFLDGRGWPAPIEVDSGNGYQLLYRIDLPTDDNGLVEEVLKVLAARHPGHNGGGVDTCVHNPARIARLPYTWNKKAHTTDARPHRLARILSIPDEFAAVPNEALQEVAALAEPEATPRKRSGAQDGVNRSGEATGRSRSFQEAVEHWNRDHAQAYPTHGSACPICDSPDGFKASQGDASRWVCFSSRHLGLASGKAGRKGNGCFTGDALDIEAWTSKRTRAQVLRDEGYLAEHSGRRRVVKAEPADAGQGVPEDLTDPGDDRAEIYYHTSDGDVPMHDLVPRAVELYAKQGSNRVYVFADSLVEVVPASASSNSDASAGAPRIMKIPQSRLRMHLDCVARWMHERITDRGATKNEERWCPPEVAKTIHELGHWDHFRVLSGVTTSPVLRRDLSVLCKPGYDAATGLLYIPSHDYPPVPEEPTQEQVDAARQTLIAPFHDFPLASEADESTLLALMLTLAARPAIQGPVPMFAITARVPGTGKTLLAECATLAVTGHLPAVTMVPGGRSSDADAEWRKRITTLALEAPRAVLLDNLDDGSVLQSSALASALTATELTDRALGTNKTVRVPHRIVWVSSGNNVALATDLARRSLAIDLDSKVEDPHLRCNFRIADLLQHVRANHPQLLVAALTVVRGYATAGCPGHGKPALGKFEAWDALVRGCVYWTTVIDPLDTQRRLRSESPEKEGLANLMTAWRENLGIDKGVQSRDLWQTPATREALEEVLPASSDILGNRSKAVGHYLKRNAGRVVDGLRIESCGTKSNARLWCLTEVKP